MFLQTEDVSPVPSKPYQCSVAATCALHFFCPNAAEAYYYRHKICPCVWENFFDSLFLVGIFITHSITAWMMPILNRKFSSCTKFVCVPVCWFLVTAWPSPFRVFLERVFLDIILHCLLPRDERVARPSCFYGLGFTIFRFIARCLNHITKLATMCHYSRLLLICNFCYSLYF